MTGRWRPVGVPGAWVVDLTGEVVVAAQLGGDHSPGRTGRRTPPADPEAWIAARVAAVGCTPTGEGKFFYTMMAAFSELERDMLQERTLAGLVAAREQGRIGGRPTVITLGPEVDDAEGLIARNLHRSMPA